MSKMIDTGVTEGDLLTSLVEELGGRRKPGDVTIRDLMKASGRSEDACRYLLNKKVELGELATAWIVDTDGVRRLAYRRKAG